MGMAQTMARRAERRLGMVAGIVARSEGIDRWLTYARLALREDRLGDAASDLASARETLTDVERVVDALRGGARAKQRAALAKRWRAETSG